MLVRCFRSRRSSTPMEIISPSVTPEAGIDGYETDRPQGPACAIACGAGTIYRNYQYRSMVSWVRALIARSTASLTLRSLPR